MPNREAFPEIFAGLKELLAPFAARFVVTADAPDSYALDAPSSPTHPKGLFFGGVQVKKSYVSYHLMPGYVFPDLLDGLPDNLRRRMQGKSCFNFTRLDDKMTAALADLTAAGAERYEREGILAGAGNEARGGSGSDGATEARR